MLRLSNNQNTSSNIGHVLGGKIVSKAPGGYVVQLHGNQTKGLVETQDILPIGKEALFRIIGIRNNLTLLHPVFAGYRN